MGARKRNRRLLIASAIVLQMMTAGMVTANGEPSGSAQWVHPADRDDVRKHIVRPGETLWHIARNYGVELRELEQYNDIENASKLMIGQTVYLPPDLLDSPDESLLPPLNADRFPPANTRPNPSEMSQLQQLFDSHKVVITPVVDPEPTRPPVLPAQLPTPSMVVKPQPEKQMQSASVSVKAEKIVADEEIEDSESPALAVFGERLYAYFGSNEQLTDALQNFAASYYIPTVIAEDVSGVVNGKIGPLKPVDFLDHLANIYGFIWYFDGHTLYVYKGNATEQRIVNLDYMSTEEFKKTLKQLGVWDGRFFWKERPKDGLVYISGPPRYVDSVAQTAEVLDKKEGQRQKSRLTVRMYRLKYAWATDKSFDFRGQQVTVPGVATLLKNIISGGGVAADRSAPTLQKMEPAAGLVGMTQQGSAPVKEKQLNSGAEAETTYISADPRLNAVIVHDLESKIPMYESLIASLDKPSSQVEVSVSIIDVNTDDIESLGVEWNNSGGSSDVNVQFDPGGSNYADNFSSFTTVLGINIGSFNARLSLLEDEGRAKVVSKPSILTLDNLEAVFDNSSTFYVPVTSQEDAELFPVTSGTVVQVTPRIVTEEVGRRIHMNVNIQDGGDSNDQALDLPRVSNSSIRTQAVVNESESLLIGGFYRESQSSKATKVPILGDIPGLGKLFRSDTKQNTSQVRLFLITPRILNIGT